MLKIDRFKSKVFVDGVETKDPNKIGIAILNLISPPKTCPKHTVNKLKEYLDKNEMTFTEERSIILNMLIKANKPFTIPQIHKQVQSGISISERTIHNAIKIFLKAKIIRRVGIGISDSKARYYEVI